MVEKQGFVWWDRRIMSDSPVEQMRKQLARGTGDWAGFSSVYRRLSGAADTLGRSSSRLGELHVETMAVMGCGDEATMKHQIHKLMQYGWL